VMGLGQTGSRAAVPLLIEELKDPHVDFERLASIALARLTHRTPFPDGRLYGEKPSEQYGRWTAWWTANGKGAAVYGPRQCGEMEALP